MTLLFSRWLSLSFCLLLSWGLLAVPQTLLPQPALTDSDGGLAGEKEAAAARRGNAE